MGHVFDENDATRTLSHGGPGDVFTIAKAPADLDVHDLLFAPVFSGRRQGVVRFQSLGEAEQGHAVGLHLFRIGDHADGSFSSAQEFDPGEIGSAGKLSRQGRHAGSQFEVVESVRGEGQDHEGHVVDREGLHLGRKALFREFVSDRHELVVNLHQARLHGFPHFETDRDQTSVRLTAGVDVFDAVQSPNRPFDGLGDLTFRLFGGESGSGGADVDHRNGNLRFLFFRGQKDGHQPQEQARDGDDRRQFRMNESAAEFSGET